MTAQPRSQRSAEESALSDRERVILRSVVDRFINTADPVGSRTIAKSSQLDLSSASIRNTMADLEEMGYLDHPYTSAGRIPTERGYRTYVDSLMEEASLSEPERETLRSGVARIRKDMDELLRESSRLLSHLSSLLGVVLSPSLSTGILDRLDVVPLSTERAMFVVSVESGLVKTIVLEVDAELQRDQLDRVVRILNERLAGLTLREIRDTYSSRVEDIDDETGIVRLVLRNAPELFSELPRSRRLQVSGTQHIMNQPEFQEVDEVQNVMQLIEQEEVVVRLVEGTEDESSGEDTGAGQARVRIGHENRSEIADKYSVVSAQYRVGEAMGSIGVIGPTRMYYPRMVALIESAAALLSRPSSLSDSDS